MAVKAPKPAKRKPPRSRSARKPATPRRPAPARRKAVAPAPPPVPEARARSAAPEGHLIEAQVGDTLTVAVRVDDGHLVPYHVGFDQRVLIDSLVSRSAATEPMTAGIHRLVWGFVHGFEQGWSHEVRVSVAGSAARVLESRSQANGDRPNTADVAVVVVR